jgi:hypothetical protein
LPGSKAKNMKMIDGGLRWRQCFLGAVCAAFIQFKTVSTAVGHRARRAVPRTVSKILRLFKGSVNSRVIT